MNFSDVVKQHTDEKHLKLLSGEAERTTTDIKVESCEEYDKKNKAFHKRLKQEHKATLDAMDAITAVVEERERLAEEQREKERQAEEEKRKQEELQRQRERKAAAEKRRQEEMAIRQEKEKKQKKVKTIISIAVIAVLILGIILMVKGCTAKYSVDNIDISVAAKYNDSASNKNVNFSLVFEVENKGSLDIHKLVGNFKIYNANGDCLLSDTLTLNGVVKPDNMLQFDVDLSLSATDKSIEIYNTDLSGLKITYQLTEVVFENYKEKEYKNSDVKVINAIASDFDKNAPSSGLKKQVDEMLVAFQSADCFSYTYVEDLNAAVDLLDAVWNSVKSNDELLEEIYADAAGYLDSKEYEKGYYLFSYLKNVPYKDSAKKAQTCYDEASTVSYDSSKPGKTGIIIEYGCMVSEVESGYDAANKIQYMDDIVEIDGRMISATDPTNDIYKKLEGKKAGDTVELGIYRNGSYMTVTIKLGYKYF